MGIWRSAAIPLLLIAIWQLAVGAHPPISGLSPTPLGVLHGFWELTETGELPKSLMESLIRIGSGFAIAFVAGVSLGVLVAMWYPAEYILDPIFETFRPI